MPNVKLILALCVRSGFLGLTLPTPKANGADPAACDQYVCKNVSYWWEGSATLIKGAAMPGKDVPALHSIQSIYTKDSNYDLPVSKTGFLIDIRTYTGCTPLCGKDAYGVWQSYQEVEKDRKSVV